MSWHCSHPVIRRHRRIRRHLIQNNRILFKSNSEREARETLICANKFTHLDSSRSQGLDLFGTGFWLKKTPELLVVGHAWIIHESFMNHWRRQLPPPLSRPQLLPVPPFFLGTNVFSAAVILLVSTATCSAGIPSTDPRLPRLSAAPCRDEAQELELVWGLGWELGWNLVDSKEMSSIDLLIPFFSSP